MSAWDKFKETQKKRIDDLKPNLTRTRFDIERHYGKNWKQSEHAGALKRGFDNIEHEHEYKKAMKEHESPYWNKK